MDLEELTIRLLMHAESTINVINEMRNYIESIEDEQIKATLRILIDTLYMNYNFFNLHRDNEVVRVEANSSDSDNETGDESE